MDNIFEAERFTDRDLIQSILASFYIIDYGYIKKVNPDKSIDVVHAKMLKTMQGETLRPTTTKSVEVLTLSCGGFALQVDYKAGDKVLLLGLKDYVPNTAKVLIATETTSYMHYTQETLKALPLCVFDNTAKVQINAENGKLSIKTADIIELDGSDNGGLCKTPELVTQLGYLTARVDTIINALKNSPTAAQDGGATYKAGITTILNGIANKEDFSNVESNKVKHGTGA